MEESGQGYREFGSKEETVVFIEGLQTVESATGVVIEANDGFAGVSWSTAVDSDALLEHVQGMLPEIRIRREIGEGVELVYAETDTMYATWIATEGHPEGDYLGMAVSKPGDLPFLRSLLERTLSDPPTHSLDFILDAAQSSFI